MKNLENKKYRNNLDQYISYMGAIKGPNIENPEKINTPFEQYTAHMNIIKGVKKEE
jgi:hypothetical protein